MGFIQGVTAGAAIRDRDRDLFRPTNPALSYAAITDGSRAMGGMNRIGTPMETGRLDMNPAAIHRRAAEMVLQEKEMDLQKSALELEKIKAATALTNEQAATTRHTREAAIEREPFERSAMIENEYQGRLKGIQADEKMTQDRKQQMQAEDFKKAMMGAHMGDGEAIKNFINQYGDPQTNVADVQFAPNGSGETIVTYEDGKSSFFKDPEQLYKGLLFWMDPQSAKVIAERTKGTKKGDDDVKEDETKSKITERLGKRWDEDNKSAAGGELTEAQKQAKDKWIAETYEKEYGTSGKKPAIQPPTKKEGTAPEKKEEAAGDENTPPVKGARKAPDGNWYVRSETGWSLVKPKGVSVATKKEETPAYGERVRGKIEKPEEGQGQKAKGKKKKTGSTTFTDQKTGEKVTRTYYADGSHDEEREKKKG